MEITLATFSSRPATTPRGMVFDNAWVPAPQYAATRNSTLTGQYPQREAATRITDVFREAGWYVTEGMESCPTGGNTFRLLEEPASLEVEGIVATAVLTDPCQLTVYWPGVAEEGHSRELVSPMDLAPTLAAIAGLDVRPNAQLSFDGLNLVPVLRYGADGHAALFFDNGIRTQDAWLIDGECSNEERRGDLQQEWELWRGFMGYGPLQ